MGKKGRYVAVFAMFLAMLGFLFSMTWGLMDANGVPVVLGLTLALIGLSELVYGVARMLTKSDGLEDKAGRR